MIAAIDTCTITRVTGQRSRLWRGCSRRTSVRVIFMFPGFFLLPTKVLILYIDYLNLWDAWLTKFFILSSLGDSWLAAFSFWIVGSVFLVWMIIMALQVSKAANR